MSDPLDKVFTTDLSKRKQLADLLEPYIRINSEGEILYLRDVPEYHKIVLCLLVAQVFRYQGKWDNEYLAPHTISEWAGVNTNTVRVGLMYLLRSGVVQMRNKTYAVNAKDYAPIEAYLRRGRAYPYDPKGKYTKAGLRKIKKADLGY
jgi:hypothetical protein